jgi:hypothetical protein
MRSSLAAALLLLLVCCRLCLAELPELYECVVGHPSLSPFRAAASTAAQPAAVPAAKVQQAVTALRDAGVKVRTAELSSCTNVCASGMWFHFFCLIRALPAAHCGDRSKHARMRIRVAACITDRLQ